NNGIKASIQKISFYKVKLNDLNLSLEEVISSFTDPTLQMAHSSPYSFAEELDGAISVSFLPGVTDNSAKALEECLRLKGWDTTCFSGSLYLIKGGKGVGKKAFELLKEEVGNSLIQEINFIEKVPLLEGERFKNISLPEVHITHQEEALEVSLDLNSDQLLKLSKDRCLALNLEEMEAIKAFYLVEKNQKVRKELGLPLWPTDVELEVLAQTWSEHCKHKIFASEIEYTDSKTGKVEVVDSLYKSYIKKATKDIESDGVDWLISVFSDNAGIVRFDNKIDLCIKVETHNSPSALDPYGGAITGILGVNRDILGCGLGAKPIANTDVFCFASTELPKKVDANKLPSGLMEPLSLLRGVHKGVEDGGNKSGIPTVNGAIVFDIDYAGKPLVFCGTIGTLPQKLEDGREGKNKGAKKGDKIYVLGGAVGADGIHGATFSSMELNEDSPATAVQIGDPLTQKRVMDFLLRARDLGLYTCITDNGAGGISSSIGEMAELTGGATIDLNTHPRKYPGLSPWEIMISESQERMTVAVHPEKAEYFEKLSQQAGVESTCMGEFTDSGRLDVFYKDERVAILPMEFLHDGVPKLKLKAIGNQSNKFGSWVNYPNTSLPKNKSDILKTLLNRENIASKDYWVRQYDHEVQGATIGKPFPGKEGISPGDSGCIDLEIHGGEKDSMATVGCGMAPRWSQENANLMAKLSVDEAVRNLISSGTNPDKICLLDNFCWPDPVATEKNPQGKEKLGQLVDTCKGLYEICKTYKAPLVSGKDSMKNDFRGKNRGGEDLVISIKPTLLVTGMGHGKKSQIV
ncbi:MAG: AIR synthase related protein, partial [Halobacteriovoraceae bacterium]|nr:AIR synthase related protein [Halobacteriovoraceae bacterium]